MGGFKKVQAQSSFNCGALISGLSSRMGLPADQAIDAVPGMRTVIDTFCNIYAMPIMESANAFAQTGKMFQSIYDQSQVDPTGSHLESIKQDLQEILFQLKEAAAALAMIGKDTPADFEALLKYAAEQGAIASSVSVGGFKSTTAQFAFGKTRLGELLKQAVLGAMSVGEANLDNSIFLTISSYPMLNFNNQRCEELIQTLSAPELFGLNPFQSLRDLVRQNNPNTTGLSSMLMVVGFLSGTEKLRDLVNKITTLFAPLMSGAMKKINALIHYMELSQQVSVAEINAMRSQMALYQTSQFKQWIFNALPLYNKYITEDAANNLYALTPLFAAQMAAKAMDQVLNKTQPVSAPENVKTNSQKHFIKIAQELDFDISGTLNIIKDQIQKRLGLQMDSSATEAIDALFKPTEVFINALTTFINKDNIKSLVSVSEGGITNVSKVQQDIGAFLKNLSTIQYVDVDPSLFSTNQAAQINFEFKKYANAFFKVMQKDPQKWKGFLQKLKSYQERYVAMQKDPQAALAAAFLHVVAGPVYEIMLSNSGLETWEATRSKDEKNYALILRTAAEPAALSGAWAGLMMRFETYREAALESAQTVLNPEAEAYGFKETSEIANVATQASFSESAKADLKKFANFIFKVLSMMPAISEHLLDVAKREQNTPGIKEDLMTNVLIKVSAGIKKMLNALKSITRDIGLIDAEMSLRKLNIDLVRAQNAKNAVLKNFPNFAPAAINLNIYQIYMAQIDTLNKFKSYMFTSPNIRLYINALILMNDGNVQNITGDSTTMVQEFKQYLVNLRQNIDGKINEIAGKAAEELHSSQTPLIK
jgi:hypothetical protein